MLKVNHFSKSYLEKTERCFIITFLCEIYHSVMLVWRLSGFSSIFDELFWIFQYFVTSKSSFLDKITKNPEDMLITNSNFLNFIWWKQNENCVLHSNVMSIFVKQTIFPQFYWPIWKIRTSAKKTDVSKVMSTDFESYYAVLIVCQVSLLAFIKLILEGRSGQYDSFPHPWVKQVFGLKNLVFRSKNLVFLLRRLVFRLKYLAFWYWKLFFHSKKVSFFVK